MAKYFWLHKKEVHDFSRIFCVLVVRPSENSTEIKKRFSGVLCAVGQWWDHLKGFGACPELVEGLKNKKAI